LLDHAVQNRKWKEAQELQPDVDFLITHVKETRARLDQVMNVHKESNLCLNMSENAKDWKSCAIWEDIYCACRQILYIHLESLKKEVKDDEARKNFLNKKRKAVPSCSQEERNVNGGQKRGGPRKQTHATLNLQPYLMAPRLVQRSKL
jgi:hypothetical protein